MKKINNIYIFTFCLLFFGLSIIGFKNSYSEEFEESFIIDDSEDTGFVSEKENKEPISENSKSENIAKDVDSKEEVKSDSDIIGIKIDTKTSEEKNETEKIEQPKIELSGVDEKDFADIVVLQGLDKITAKISTFEIKVGESAKFKRLEIDVKKCWKSPPEENPENKALLEIYENRLDGKKERVFYGWMFSSSPGLSSLEHPVYDITVIDCRFSKDKEEDEVKKDAVKEDEVNNNETKDNKEENEDFEDEQD